MKKSSLTTLEAAMLVCGCGLGTGILAVPYLSRNLGTLQIVAAVGVAFAVTAILHLMVADLALASPDSVQLMSVFKKHLFTGKSGPLAANAFFALLVVVLLANLTLYVTCASEVLTATFGLPDLIAKLLFYLVASMMILPGLKIVGISETYSMLLIAAVLVILSVLSLRVKGTFPQISIGSLLHTASLYSLCMFSFSALFSVPQIVVGLGDRRKIRIGILAGTGTNALITLGFTLIVLRSGAEVTKVATVGLSSALGQLAEVVCAIFVILAMLTSFWSVALAQLDMIGEMFSFRRTASWLLATLPVLLFALILPFGYLSYIEIVGGAVAIIVALLVLPAYRRAISGSTAPLMLSRLGRSRILLGVVLIFYILMAVFSFV